MTKKTVARGGGGEMDPADATWDDDDDDSVRELVMLFENVQTQKTLIFFHSLWLWLSSSCL